MSFHGSTCLLRSCLAMVALIASGPAVSSPPSAARDLSFAERVAAQRAIERVYFSHQIGTNRTFGEAVPSSRLEGKVRNYLKLSVALGEVWRRPVTAEMLAAELERIARNTRFPGRLREIYDALSNDPFLIQECFVRPVLVERLARSFHAGTVALRSGAAPGKAGATDPTDSWDAWWETMSSIIDENAARPSASAQVSLPLPNAGGNEGTEGTCPDDAWTYGLGGDFPPDAPVGPSVWTGSHMIFWGGSIYPTGRKYDPLTDTWALMSGLGAPSARLKHTLTWTGSEVIVWGGRFDGVNRGDGGRYDPVSDSWSPMSNAGTEPRSYHTAVWTGTEMIVWSGFGEPWLTTSGERYDPATDSWTPISLDGAPAGRYEHTAVWTGTKMIVWGGRTSTLDLLNTGGVYDPVADTWASTNTAGAPAARTGHTAVWAGTRMIVWGGHLGTNVLTNTGGRYDPIGDAWTSTPTSSLISARYLHTAIWTGTEMIVWGGSEQLVSSGPGETNTGARFLPSLNLWLPTSTVGAPVGRYGHAVVWTGSEMLVWGGQHSGQITTSGGRYDPSADAWTPMGDGSGPSARTRTTAVWTGNELIIWGGLDPGAPGYGQVATGGRYDPLTDTWLDTPIPMIQGRESHSAVWTGQWMVVWGGTRVDSGTRSYLSDGAMYDPVADSWLLIPSGGLTGRVGHAAVWTGDRMIVWGPSDGGVFDPETLGWAPMTSTGSPSPRTSHTMIWTGEEAIVWGGSGPVNTGARYDPVGDVWTPLALVGAPSPRSGHTAIWNGSRMIVWGGIESSRYSADTGAAYDPAADLWTPISAIGAAGPRDGHTAVWTGTRMIVWGGRYSEPGAGGSLTTSDLGDGGSYIPVTDTWSPMSLDGAPPARSDHRAVWSGQAMLIWGGGTHDGGSYRTGLNSDVDLDSWTPCDGDCDDGEPATHPGAVEICDGADNDCDGALPGEVDADGDGLWECEGDCDDTNPARFPGNPETCDGVDNDCDDVVDGFITTCGMGECASGGFCSGGVDSCVPGTPVPELCDNLDNDCDGAVDGFSTACGVGQCAAAGTCSAGADSCVPGSPTLEVCDGVDNDCDGSIPADEADDDGDGSRLCDGDCAPSDPSIFAGAPEINDGTDNQCPGDYGFGIIDEISGQTTMSEVGQLCWPSQGGATLYRIVRAETRDFTAGCVSNTSASSCWTDPETPASGAAFQYVVRAEAPHVGSWGLQGDLTERGVACTSEQDCANGTDDDGDGLVDCADAEDCFRDPACGSASFQLLDLPSDDAADTDLADFFSGVPALATDYIHFSLAGNGLISFEWCAERADVYRDDYLAYAPGGNVLVSGGWSAWYREGGGVWSAPVATEFPNYYGNQCLGAYSWCAETELGNRGLAIVPSDTAGCEAVDLVYGCGDGTWVLAITLGVDRISACGF